MKSDIELDAAATDEGKALTEEVGTDWSLEAIQATVDAVKDAGKVALVGYAWGGFLAYTAANKVKGLACAIGYHAEEGILDGMSEKRRIPTLMHFAEATAIAEADMIQFRARRPDVSAFSYPGANRGFSYKANPAYDAAAADQAMERTHPGSPSSGSRGASVASEECRRLCPREDREEGQEEVRGNDMGPPMD